LAAADMRPLLMRRRQGGGTPGISPAVSDPSTPHGGKQLCSGQSVNLSHHCSGRLSAHIHAPCTVDGCCLWAVDP
jgi:hypothetical protein